MKIITKAVFIVDDGKELPAGSEIDWIDEAEATRFVERGLADLAPESPSAEAETKAAKKTADKGGES